MKPIVIRVRSILRRHGAKIGYLILAAGMIFIWHTVDEERDARIEHACRTERVSIAEERTMWVNVLREAGVDEPTIDILRRGYDNLPAPAACQ